MAGRIGHWTLNSQKEIRDMIFSARVSRDMYDEAIESGVINEVEPHTTTLMYKMGKRIYFAKGSQTNIKITRKEDLALFEGYIMRQKEYEENKMSGDVIVFLADGFEECEGLLIVDLLRRAGLKTVLTSIMGRKTVCSSRGISIQADVLAECVDYRYKVRGSIALRESENDEYLLVFNMLEVDPFPMTTKARENAGVLNEELDEESLTELNRLEEERNRQKEERERAKAAGEKPKKMKSSRKSPWIENYSEDFDQYR